MVTRFLLIFTLLFTIPIKGLAIELTFESLKHYVETKNKRVMEYENKVEAEKLRQGRLARSFLPNLSLSGGYEKFEAGLNISGVQPYYGAETSLNIYNGKNDQFQDEIQKLRLERKVNEAQKIKSKELAASRELFWNIIYVQKEIGLKEAMQNINEKNLRAANKRIKSGVATPSDRLEFEMKKLDLKRDIKRLKIKKQLLSNKLLVHLGLNINEPLKVIGDLVHIDEWEQDLKHSHEDHEFYSKPYELLAKELEVKKNKMQMWWAPKVDLYAGWYQHNQREEASANERERQESALGIRFKINLFDGMISSREAKALAIEARAAKAASDFLKSKNEAHIEEEFLELKSLHSQVHEAEAHIIMARKYYRATQAEYARGAKNSPDVLGAAEKFESVVRKKNQLIRNFHIARSHVLSKIGR